MRYGILASFGTPEELLRAVDALRTHGYRRLDAFTPYPVHGLEQALGLSRSPLGKMLFPVGMVSAALGYLIQLWCNGWDYPINVGGRPLNSVPAYIPITFETGVLLTSLVGVFLFLLLTGLPKLYTPVADVDGIERASIDRFVLGVDDTDPQYSEIDLDRELRSLGALSIGHARARTP